MKKKILVLLNLILILFMATSCMYSETDSSNSTNKQYFMGGFNSLNTGVKLGVEAKNLKQSQMYLNNVQKIYDEVDKIADAEISEFINEYTGDSYSSPKIDNIKSELGKLNYYRELEVSQSLIDLLSFSLNAQEKTLGYFNPNLGILNGKWKAVIKGVRNPALNNDGECIEYSQKALNAIIEIDDDKNIVRLKNKDGQLSTYNDYLVDLGGIAKGYATEKAKRYLIKNNVKNYLINAGASNIEVGKHMINDNWNVGISYAFPYPNKNPFISKKDGYFYIDGVKTKIEAKNNTNAFVTEDFLYFKDLAQMSNGDMLFSLKDSKYYYYDGVSLEEKGEIIPVKIKVKNKAIVTSSPGQQHKIIKGQIYHHIINPFTGRPADLNRESVTIVGDDSALLDAFSTALFIMDDNKAQEFIKMNNLEVLFLNNSKVSYVSEGIIYEETHFS